MKSRLKIIISLAVLILVILLFIVAILIYRALYDISDLTLYENEKIQSIVKYGDQVYLVDENGKGYILGGYSFSTKRTYLNSKARTHEGLNMSNPVLFFDGNIRQLIPYSRMSVLIITKDNELYAWHDFEIEKVADGVICADINPINNEVYYINLNKELILRQENGLEQLILTGANKVVLYSDNAYVLLENHKLCEFKCDDYENVQLSYCEIEGIVDFEVVDTSLRFNGEKYIFDDETAIESPLITALCNDGNLYVKGAYNLLSCHTNFADKKPEPYIINDWTIIGENVFSFSSAPMGTVMLHNDKSCSYYGFDTCVSNESIFQQYNIPIEKIESVHASETTVCLIGQDDKIYIYGQNAFNPLLEKASNRHHLYKDSPLIISTNGQTLQD